MPLLYSIPFQTIKGDSTSLNEYAGKVLLLVNVASECGYTPQYDGMEKIYEQYKDQGLVVIGFPANNFGGQEPGTNEEIAHFCKNIYGVNFPMMAKISVKGDDIHPLFRYLIDHSDSDEDLTWNFNKFLVDRSGNVAARYTNKMVPEDPELTGKIESLLKQ